jgi:ATP-dependent DNA helicase
MNSGDGTEGILNKSSVVTSLHAILKPFLLRRLKVDVEKDLPPKKEYLLYAPLTQQQKDIYQAIVSRNIRRYLTDKMSGKEEEGEAAVEEIAHGNAKENGVRSTRKKDRVDYKIEENDSKFIRDLEDGVAKEEPSGVKEKSAAEVGQEWALKQASEFSFSYQRRRGLKLTR